MPKSIFSHYAFNFFLMRPKKKTEEKIYQITHCHDLLSSVKRVTPLCAAKLQMCTDTLSVLASMRCNLLNNEQLSFSLGIEINETF